LIGAPRQPYIDTKIDENTYYNTMQGANDEKIMLLGEFGKNYAERFFPVLYNRSTADEEEETEEEAAA